MKKSALIIIILIVLCLFALTVTACRSSDVLNITIYDEPTQTTYVVGEALDVTGCRINVNYADGSSKIVNVTNEMVSNFNTSNIGDSTFTITYTIGKQVYTTTQAIRTVGRLASSLTITTPPTKTDYVEGQLIDLEGIVVDVVYNNDETETVGASAVTADPLITHLGQTSVSVIMDNASGVFNITVVEKAVAGISIYTLPDKTEYVEGELFEQEGLILGVVYNDDSTVQLTEGFEIVDSTILLDTENIIVRYSDYITNCPITVSAKEAIDYTIINAPKTQYTEGETLDLNGLEIDIEYNNGNTITLINDGVNQQHWTDVSVISPDGAVSVEDNQIILHYFYGEGETDYLEIAIDINVDMVMVVGFEEVRCNDYFRTEYTEGEAISFMGLELAAVYNNGTKETIIDDEPQNPNVLYDHIALIGMEQVEISYLGLTYTYNITVILEE